MTTPEPTAGIVLGEGPLLPEQRAELEEIRAVVATGDSLGSANATWLVAIVDRLDAALAAAREAGREEGRLEELQRIAAKQDRLWWMKYGDAVERSAAATCPAHPVGMACPAVPEMCADRRCICCDRAVTGGPRA